MSKLDELIKTFCPDGVAYKTLGELGSFYGGLTGKSKKDFDNGNAKYITYMNIYLNAEVKTELAECVSVGADERQNKVLYGDVLFTGSSESKEECAIASVMTELTEEAFYLNSFCFGFRMTNPQLLLPAFSKHLFRCEMLRKQLQNTASGVTRFNVSKEKMAKVRIPLPPLEVQEEIVRILDEYSEKNAQLIEALNDECKARKIQYEYYRQFTFSSLFEYSRPLGEVCAFQNGFAFKSAKFKDEGLPIVRISNIQESKICREKMVFFSADDYRENLERYTVKRGDIVIAMSGATTGKIAANDSEEIYYINQRVGKFVPDASVLLNEYLFFVLEANSAEILSISEGGAQPNLSSEDIKKMLIPVPSIDVQEKVARQMEAYRVCYTELVDSLEKEIRLRKSQYEYNRDKLLTFIELS